MSETRVEQISALLDGELSAAETQVLLADYKADEAGVGQHMRNMQLVGAALRAEPVPASGFAQRVIAAVEQEQQPDLAAAQEQPASIEQNTERWSWLKPLGGFAVAAGVAAVALVVMEPFSETGGAQVAANGDSQAPAVVAEQQGADSELPVVDLSGGIRTVGNDQPEHQPTARPEQRSTQP